MKDDSGPLTGYDPPSEARISPSPGFGAPNFTEAPREFRTKRLVLVLEVDVSALQRLRRHALDPRAQVLVVVVRPAQPQVAAVRGAHERRVALVEVRHAQCGTVLLECRVHVIV